MKRGEIVVQTIPETNKMGGWRKKEKKRMISNKKQKEKTVKRSEISLENVNVGKGKHGIKWRKTTIPIYYNKDI